MKVVPPDHPQSGHSRPFFSAGSCFVPDPCGSPGESAGWDAACGLGRPVREALGGLHTGPQLHRPHCPSKLSCAMDGSLTSFLQQIRGSDGPHCVEHENPIPMPEGS